MKLTEEERQDVIRIMSEYSTLNMFSENYRQELENIYTHMEMIENDIKKLKEKEERLMNDLHVKYGDFTMQELLDYLIDVRNGFAE